MDCQGKYLCRSWRCSYSFRVLLLAKSLSCIKLLLQFQNRCWWEGGKNFQFATRDSLAMEAYFLQLWIVLVHCLCLKSHEINTGDGCRSVTKKSNEEKDNSVGRANIGRDNKILAYKE
ncbi:hypothetical protein ACHQM5_012027 [Ranunculus cassubicifolius]